MTDKILNVKVSSLLMQGVSANKVITLLEREGFDREDIIARIDPEILASYGDLKSSMRLARMLGAVIFLIGGGYCLYLAFGFEGYLIVNGFFLMMMLYGLYAMVVGSFPGITK